MDNAERGRLKILVVDDENGILLTLKKVLKDFDLTLISDGKEAVDSIRNGGKYDILVIDFRLQAFSGLDILIEAKQHLTCYQAILLTAYSEKALLEQIINDKLVHKIVNKPIPENFSVIVEEAADAYLKEFKKLKHNDFLEKENEALIISSSVKSCDQIFLHKSEVMKIAVAAATKYANSIANLIITGESGAGKEEIANIVHINGKRAEKPFIKVNCAAFPEAMFEAELFGYEKGAFTGAIRSKSGKFKLANEGTIFLDEIGDLTLINQSKILRAVENKEISPIGSLETLKLDVRIICATNVDLREKVETGQFREDLYQRLNILNIHVPSLRERREDIPILASYFIKTITLEEGGPEKEISPEALEYLSKLDFVGNVRQLKSLMHRVYLSGKNSEITLADVIEDVSKSNVKSSGENLFEESIALSSWNRNAEKKYIETQLGKFEYNISKTAEVLGMQKTNLYRKMRELDISVGDKE